MTELWEVARGPGQPPKFKSPQEMWELAVEYFKWCGEHVVLEERTGFYQGTAASAYVGHKRPMTQSGLCVFLGIGVSTWHDYKKRDVFSEVTREIESVMYEQKFTGAATGQFNANIIARDLGLADKQDLSSSDGSMSPKSFSDLYGKSKSKSD